MTRSPRLRAEDVKLRIGYIRGLLRDKTFEDAYGDPTTFAAFERFLEIISEASRHLPEEWRSAYGPNIPWRQVIDLGNRLRHVYHRADYEVLWAIYETDLDPLEAAIDAMLAAYPT